MVCSQSLATQKTMLQCTIAGGRIKGTEGPCKRSQHCWPTRRNIVGPNMLRAFAHHVVCCCVLLRLVGSCWMKFDQFQTSSNKSQQHTICVQTLATCWAQHCCVLLANDVASVCTGLDEKSFVFVHQHDGCDATWKPPIPDLFCCFVSTMDNYP